MLEKAVEPHSSTLAWKTPCMEEPGRLRSMGSQRVGHDWSDFTFTFHFHALEKEMATRSSALAWRIPGTEEPGGLPSMGSHRVRHNWSDLAAVAAAEPSGGRLYLWFWPLYHSFTCSVTDSLARFSPGSIHHLHSGTRHWARCSACAVQCRHPCPQGLHAVRRPTGHRRGPHCSL